MVDLDALKREIEALSPPDKLRLAAELLEARRPCKKHAPRTRKKGTR